MRARRVSAADLVITTMTYPHIYINNRSFEKRVRSNGELNDPFLFTKHDSML